MKCKIICIILVITVSFSCAFSIRSSASSAVIGLTVVGGILVSMLINDILGGAGYDFGDFISDGINAVCVSTDVVKRYWVTGFTCSLSSINELFYSHMSDYKAAESAVTVYNRLNSAIQSGDIKIYYNSETRKFSVSGTELTDFIRTTLELFGSRTGVDENGNPYRYISQYEVVSPYITACFEGTSVSIANSEYYQYFINPYVILSDGTLLFYNSRVKVASSTTLYFLSAGVSYPDSASGIYMHPDPTQLTDLGITSQSYNSLTYFIFNFHGDSVTIAMNNPYGVYSAYENSRSFNMDMIFSFIENADNYSRYSDVSSLIVSSGFVAVPISQWTHFHNAYVSGEVSYSETRISADTDLITDISEGESEYEHPVTVVVDESGTTTVVKENRFPEVDLDIPEQSVFWDKFPFSIPFDFYRILTIFVRDPIDPVFTFPIETTIQPDGLNYDVDEEIVLDLTIFEWNGHDILQVFLRSVFYVAFVICLIKLTPRFKD